jgi:hypothetical protein
VTLIAKNLSTGAVIADKVAIADSRATRRTGLLKHASLAAGEGLWIVPCRGVHTFQMKFAIDIVALDGTGVVIDRVTNMRPWRIRLPRRGTAGVLELAAGSLDQTGTSLGHRIELSVQQS